MQAVNGALWTLKIEVMFYLPVPLVVMAFAKLGRLPVLMALYVGSVIYFASMGTLAAQSGSGVYLELQRQLPGQLAFFVAGAAGYYYFQYLGRYAMPLVGAAVGAFMLQDWLPWAIVQPLALAMVVVFGACFFSLSWEFWQVRRFLLRDIHRSFPDTATADSEREFSERTLVVAFVGHRAGLGGCGPTLAFRRETFSA